MTKDTFLHELKQGSTAQIENYSLYYKPCVLVNDDTEEEVRFKNIAEAYEKALINGRKIAEVVAESDYEDLFPLPVFDDWDIQFARLEEKEALGE